MSLGATPKLVSDLGSHDSATRRHIRRILEISELDALYNNIFVATLVINKDIVCLNIY